MTAADAGAAGWNAAQNAPPEVKTAASDYATQQATAEVRKVCGFDMTYVKSINGIMKGKQFLWSFIAFMLMAIDIGINAAKIFFGLFVFPTMLCIIVLWFVFATHLYEKHPQVPWFLADLGISAGAAVYYLIMGIVLITTFDPLLVASGVFALIGAIFAFAPGSWLSYKRYRESKHHVTENQAI